MELWTRSEEKLVEIIDSMLKAGWHLVDVSIVGDAATVRFIKGSLVKVVTILANEILEDVVYEIRTVQGERQSN